MKKASEQVGGRSRWDQIRLVNSLFLGSTFLLTVCGVPLYAWQFGLDAFQLSLFGFFFAATGLSITLGYHRLYSHGSFKAGWLVRILTLVFGAAAFENSAICWAADHRRHHKCVDHEEDPYDISKGFFHAHVGWILFRYEPETCLDWAKDLQRDRLVMWQHRFYLPLAVAVGFVLPALLGWAVAGWVGALGGFLVGGVARVFCVHHMTFFINSLCHTLGRQPYSSKCTARDSAVMAWLTFGEGYHNFHHEFQHDYRNGVKAWQFDPTKWSIWLLHQFGLVQQLRRVPEEKILLAQAAEQQRQMADKLRAHPTPLADTIHHMLQAAQFRLQLASASWEERKAAYRLAAETRMEASREKLAELGRELQESTARLRAALQEWQEARRLALAQLA